MRSRARNRFVGGTATGLLALASSAALAAAAEPAAEHHPPSPLTLAWCLERAASNNPALQADAHAADAAHERVIPAGALEDPRFSYEASNLPVGSWDFGSTPLSGHQLWLRQKLPLPGLLTSRTGAARASASAADFGVSDHRRSLASEVERAWAELGYSQRALGITRRNIELLRRLARTAEARYGVGVGLQQDVLRAQVELTALLQERLAREAAVSRAEAGLASLLDLPSAASLPVTAELPENSALPQLEVLVARLDATSPRLQAWAARVEAASREMRAAELQGYPDVDLGIGYRIRQQVVGDPVDGDDFFSAAFTLRLPVNRPRWRAEVAERRAHARRAEALLRDERARLVEALRRAHADLVQADAEARLLDTGLVPQARQSFESSRSGYEVGRIGFLSLLDSQVRLLRAELERVRAQADRRTAFAALEAAYGESLR